MLLREEGARRQMLLEAILLSPIFDKAIISLVVDEVYIHMTNYVILVRSSTTVHRLYLTIGK